MPRYEDIKVGDKAEIKHIITKKDIETFADLTGDDNQLHVDEEYAARTSFKKPVAHGMLSASFISTIIGTKLPGDGALWYSQQLNFLQQVRVGDEITVRAEVIRKHDRLRAIELKTDVYNQNNQKVIEGFAKVKVIEEEKPQPEVKRSEPPKIAFVAGATGGIGSAVCRKLSSMGYALILHFHSNRAGAETLRQSLRQHGNKVITVQGDLTSEADMQAIAEKVNRHFEYVPVLINCTTPPIPNVKFEDLKWETIEHHFRANIKGAYSLIRAFLPAMEQHQYGKIIHLTTIFTEQPVTETLHYITAKAALNGFSKALAAELGPKGIRVNLVSPGMTDTPLISEVPNKVKLLVSSRAPLRRLATSEDVAGVIAFLASPESDYLTGETIRVNGGQVML